MYIPFQKRLMCRKANRKLQNSPLSLPSTPVLENGGILCPTYQASGFSYIISCGLLLWSFMGKSSFCYQKAKALTVTANTVWMHMLIWAFPGRTCDFVGNAVPRLILQIVIDIVYDAFKYISPFRTTLNLLLELTLYPFRLWSGLFYLWISNHVANRGVC